VTALFVNRRRVASRLSAATVDHPEVDAATFSMEKSIDLLNDTHKSFLL